MTTPDPFIGQTIGNYIVRHKLGEGGMGSVYLAEHPAIGKKVALKVLHAEFASRQEVVNRFFNEAKAVNDIQHPNIVDIVDFGVMPTGPAGEPVVYFIMEFLAGVGLADLVKSDAPLPPERALTIALQIADALAASHKKGIVHRDLKPDNVILVSRGRERDFVKLLDFGIAKLTGGQPAGSQRTRTGMVMGTPHYMSPEQCEGRGNVDHRTDVYALGIVLYQMLTGHVPFPGEGYGEVLVQHMTRPPIPLISINSQVPPHVEQIVLKALEKKPDARYPTMDEMMLAIADPVGYVESHGGIGGFRQATLEASNAALPTIRLTPMSLTPVPGSIHAPHAQTTTLGGSAAEVATQPPRKSRTGMIIGISLAVAAAGGAAVAFTMKNKGSGDPAPETTAAVEPADDEPTPTPDPVKDPEPTAEAPAPTPTTTPPPTPAPVAPEKTTFHLSIDSEPSGATVLVDGKKKGVTPFKGDLDKGTAAVEVKLVLKDHEPTTQSIQPDGDVTLDLVLEKHRRSDSRSDHRKPKKPKTKTGGGGTSGTSTDDTKNPFDRLKKGNQ